MTVHCAFSSSKWATGKTLTGKRQAIVTGTVGTLGAPLLHSLWMNTMIRCTRSHDRVAAHVVAALALVIGSTAIVSPPAAAQGIVREAPKDVRPARMVVTAAPHITLDDKPEQLSPGARIRDLNNMLVLSASLTGKDVPVVYRRDAAGLVHEVWILTPDEYRRLGGLDDGTPDGHKKLTELLTLIFGARK